MNRSIDTLLLLALPASGKSELRRYLASLSPELAESELHLGPVVQLDDYPYVNMMRRLSEEMVRAGVSPAFFSAADRPFTNKWDWGTLIHLLNQDYAALGAPLERPKSAASWLIQRFDAAREEVGQDPVTRGLPSDIHEHVMDAIEQEASSLWTELSSTLSTWREGATVVIEFARGGPDGATMPLADPLGYGYALRELSVDIKRRASILYVWVTPEESRRRNTERARPGREGDASILFHGVPEEVMYREYGTDDLIWLAEQSGGHSINTNGTAIPVGIFDNRDDRTSFLRAEQESWPEEKVAALHEALKGTLDALVN